MYSHIQFGGVDWHFYPLRGLVRARASQEGTALVPLDIVPLVIDGEVSLRRCRGSVRYSGDMRISRGDYIGEIDAVSLTAQREFRMCKRFGLG